MMTIMHKNSVQIFYTFLIVFLLHMKPAISGIKGAKFWCIEKERQALLKFKQELEDDYGVLSSWVSEDEKSDCCQWRGVGCSNRTGHVTLLDLNGWTSMPLRGKISDSLLELQHLNYLDLSSNDFSGSPFPHFVGSLNRLRYLNLHDTSISGTLSYQFGNLSRLQYLDLSSNNLAFTTFNWLSNFSNNLVDLNLGYNWNISPENIEWLPHLSSLEHLDLSGNSLTSVTDWPLVVQKLPRLKDLQLRDCSLSNIVPPSLSLTNSSKSLASLDLSNNNLTSSVFPLLSSFSNSLVDLDLSWNQLQGSIPDAFRNMSSLKNLDLSVNQLQGISRSFQQMCSLRTLYLGDNSLIGQLSQFFENLYGCMENSLEILWLTGNQLHGSVPDFTRLPSMRVLDLSSNQLNGSLPERFRQRSKLVSLSLNGNQLTGSLTDVAMLSSLRELLIDDNRFDGNVSESIGSLSELEILSAPGNSLQGIVSEGHFSNPSKLQTLDFSGNSLDLKFESHWSPPFQLDRLYLISCNLGPHFPQWLQNQNNLSELDISCAGISDTIPNWFWDLSNSKLDYLNLSHNKMSGMLPDLSTKCSRLRTVDLSFNQFEGPLPRFPSNSTSTLYLSNNMFSGPVSLICMIAGWVLSFLDLSNNLLSGQLPDCLMQLANVNILNLADNYYSGEIPSSIGSLLYLQTLSLRNNSFSGELPFSLRNCSDLVFLDLSANKFHGKIPAWIGESMLSLKFLSLQSNEFYGSIPVHLCQLTSIQILDLSLNKISGIIPKCVNNFTSMVQKEDSSNGNGMLSYGARYSFNGAKTTDLYFNKVKVGWKGREYEYERTLGLLRIVDFSGNKLTGEIPEEITELLQLVALNLSRNSLTDVIPLKIGRLKQLETLDLSGNQLSGVIPATLADLNFLDDLNLSYNNLSGKIPSSTQLQSFNASAFLVNLALCGPPLTQKCPGDETPPSPPANDDRQGNEEHVDEFWKWFYTAMGIGFSVFFWGVSSALLLKRSWRHAYFQYLEEAWDWIYVRIAVHRARLLQKFQSLS